MEKHTDTDLYAKFLALYNEFNRLCIKYNFDRGDIDDMIDTFGVVDNKSKFLRDVCAFQKEFYKALSQIYNLNGMAQVVSFKDYKKLDDQLFFVDNKGFPMLELAFGKNDTNRQIEVMFNKTFNCNFENYKFDKCDVLSHRGYIFNNEEFKRTSPLRFKLNESNVISTASLRTISSHVKENSILWTRQFDDKFEMIFSFMDNHKNDEELNEFLPFLLSRLPVLAVTLGYDAIYSDHHNYFKVLNRAKMCVCQEEYDRILKLSETFSS